MNDNVRLVAFALYCKEISGDDHDLLFVKDDDINVLWDKYKWVMEGLEETHFGDCTKDAIPCVRCRADNLIEDAEFIIKHWEGNDEIIKERKIDIEKNLKESMAMDEAIRSGIYKPVTKVETISGQSLVRIVDRQTGKTWDEVYEEIKKKEK